jgi:uncharacterized iron-regulated protein
MRPSRLACLLLPLIIGASPARACDVSENHVPLLFDRIVQSWTALDKHPLIGVIYDTRGALPDARKVSRDGSCQDSGDFWNLLEHPDILLLGEVHDNSEHHRLRARLLHGGAVVSEHITTDQVLALARFKETVRNTGRMLTVEDFKDQLNWQASGWPDDVAELLFTAALQNKLPIYPGDVPRNTILRLSKQGQAAIDPKDAARMALDVPLDAQLDNALITEIGEAHCGVMPKEALAGMAFAQRFRDAHMAGMLLKASEEHGSAILIAGNGHVRNDRGVPWYLRHRAPGKTVVSVMLIEVEEGQNASDSYVPKGPDGKPAADFLIFTPRAARADPCVSLRARMKK